MSEITEAVADPTLTLDWARRWLLQAADDFDRDEFMDHIERIVAARTAAIERVQALADEWAHLDSFVAWKVTGLPRLRAALASPSIEEHDAMVEELHHRIEQAERARALCDDNDQPNDVDIHVPGFVRVNDLRRILDGGEPT